MPIPRFRVLSHIGRHELVRLAASLRHSYFICEACRRCEGCTGRHAALTRLALPSLLVCAENSKPVESAGMNPAAGVQATRWRVGEVEEKQMASCKTNAMRRDITLAASTEASTSRLWPVYIKHFSMELVTVVVHIRCLAALKRPARSSLGQQPP